MNLVLKKADINTVKKNIHKKAFSNKQLNEPCPKTCLLFMTTKKFPY